MKLSYRGLPYKLSAHSLPTSSASATTPQPEVRLTCRGQTYLSQPRLSPEAVLVDAPVVILMYRGQLYQRNSLTAKPYRHPHAFNWRWQLHSEL